MTTESVDLQKLSLYVPNKASLYRVMIKKGYFLPNETSKACSEEYLLECLHDKVFTMKIDKLKPFILKEDLSSSCLDLIEQLKTKTTKPLGFTPTKLPDKNWLIDVLHSLDPENKLFFNPGELITRELPQG